MTKKLKLLLLLLEIILLSIFLINGKYQISLCIFMVLGYNLYLFFKWKRVKAKSEFIFRSHITVDIILLCFLIFLFRILQIQFFNSEKYKKAIQRQINVKIQENGSRGKIYDSNEKELVYNIESYNLIINPKILMDFPTGELFLKELIDKGYVKGNKNEILRKVRFLAENNKKYRKLNEIGSEEKKKVIEIIKKYNLTNQNVIYLEAVKRRKYYKSFIHNSLIGDIGYKNSTEKEGIFGIELYYEKYLKGLKRDKLIPIVRGLKIGVPTSDIDTKIDLDGKNLHLTIDNEISYILNSEMKKQFDLTNSEEAYGIVMNPNNGQILATSFHQKDQRNMKNPIFQSLFEPGSIFKPIIVAAALENKKIQSNTLFDIGNGTYEKYGHTIRESSKNLKGVLNVTEIVKRSSNIGMILISEKFTDYEFNEWLKKYGLYEKTGVDYPYEQSSKSIPVSKWDGLKKNNIAFGQGIAITPLQMITAFSAVINGGYLYRPYIVDKITDDNDVIIRRNLPEVRRRILSEKTTAKMKQMMERAVLEGTVRKARVEGYRIGGKTGTAQISENGTYIKGNYLSSVIGFFPVENPQYIILSMFFKPQSKKENEKYGGTAAAPVLGRIIKRIAKLKNIYSQNIKNIESGIKEKSLKNSISLKRISVNGRMPDLTELTAREVLELLKKSNIDIKIVGTGVVVKQYPEANTDLSAVKEIKIILKEE